MLSREHMPDPRGDDRERTATARQAAEALFASKAPISEPPVSKTTTGDQTPRKPRVLPVILPPVPVRRDERREGRSAAESQATHAIPRADIARIQTWLKYGMTTRLVANIFGIAVDEIGRALRNT